MSVGVEIPIHEHHDPEDEIPCTADIGLTDQELELEKWGTRALFQQMPDSGTGFVCYGPVRKRFGKPEVVRTIQHICKQWQQKFPDGPRLRIGNISLQGGGPVPPHKSHRKGVDVDIAPIASTNEEIPLTWEHPRYSRERSQWLVDQIHKNPFVKVKVILFNDPNIHGVKSWPGHDNHLHVSFYPTGVKKESISSDQAGDLRLTRPFMKGERVRKLQDGLASVGIEIDVDSVFGNDTDAAVRRFQADYELEVDGIAGNVTLAKLQEIKSQIVVAETATTSINEAATLPSSLKLLSPNLKGERVRQLQADLDQLGINVEVDGVFGKGTETAVKKFQTRYGLLSDGVAGPATLSKLEETKNKAASGTAPTIISADTSGMALQAIIDQNRAIDFSNVNDSDLIDDRELCREAQAILQSCGLLQTVDGLFGPRTQEALRTFRASNQLLGGDLLDALTAKALLLARPVGGVLPTWSGGDRQAAIQAIIQEAKRHGIGSKTQIAYILATVEHETAGSFQPVKEAYYLGEPKAEKHRKTLRYYPYYGRGYVQLTWDYNYRAYSSLLGMDLVNQPDLVIRPDISLFILVDGMKRGVFTGRALQKYISDSRVDFVNARRIINGIDKAHRIAGLATNWNTNLA